MEMKKLFSLALLISAFVAAPTFAKSGEEDDVETKAPKTEQTEPKEDNKGTEKPKSWCPLNFKKCPIVKELSGVLDPIGSVKSYGSYVNRVVLHNPVKAFITFAVLTSLYNNLDNIKAALGLGEDEQEADAGEIFASADKCGCENAEVQDEAVVASEEEAKEEVCEFKKKETKEVQA